MEHTHICDTMNKVDWILLCIYVVLGTWKFMELAKKAGEWSAKKIKEM